MRKTVFVCLVAAAILMSPLTGFADCPDEGTCQLSWGWDGGMWKDVGTIKTPTCWKFGKGCRPWHCDGYKDTDAEYWLNRCVQTFNVKHDPSHSNETLWITFKGGITGNYSRKLQ